VQTTVIFQAFVAENRGYFAHPGYPYSFAGMSWAACRGGKFALSER